jgi:hypothetical protein
MPYAKTQKRDVGFVKSWPPYRYPQPYDEYRHAEGIDEQPGYFGKVCAVRASRTWYSSSTGYYIPTDTRSTAAWGYWMDRSSNENMR